MASTDRTLSLPLLAPIQEGQKLKAEAVRVCAAQPAAGEAAEGSAGMRDYAEEQRHSSVKLMQSLQAGTQRQQRQRPPRQRLHRSKTEPSFRKTQSGLSGGRSSEGRSERSRRELLPFIPGDRQPTSVLMIAIVALSAYLAIGVGCYWFFSNSIVGNRSTQDLVDGLYFCVVTMCTVGYGDLVPVTTPAKLFCCVFVFIGFGIVDVLLSAAANYLVMKQENILEKVFYAHYSSKPGSSQKRDSPVPAPKPGMSWARLQLTEQREGEEDDDYELRRVWFRVGFAFSLLAATMVLGVTVLCLVEKMSFVDALYCASVTVTTVGYGDNHFKTLWGRLFAVGWVLASTVIVAQAFFTLAEARVAERQHGLAKWVLTRKTTETDLEAADLDMNGCVSRAEFVLYKLKELGKVSEHDLINIYREFDTLDVNRDGSLDEEDLAAAEQAQERMSGSRSRT